ncbi:hypothetical protein [Streptomyces violascens]|uniref:hypothetical protein n=1 Tax=Streptomyces violascens TaxID=67381 RepID=UPI003696493E
MGFPIARFTATLMHELMAEHQTQDVEFAGEIFPTVHEAKASGGGVAAALTQTYEFP